MGSYDELYSEIKYKGLIFDVVQRTVLLPNGKEAKRDIIEHNGAAAIVAVTENGGIILVRQYREAVKGFMLELPAGKLEKGEDPKLCAIRELEEETGYKAEDARFLLCYHPAAAYCEELIHLYTAEGLTPGTPNPDSDEFVSAEVYPLETVLEMIGNGEITDMKTIAGVLYYEAAKASF